MKSTCTRSTQVTVNGHITAHIGGARKCFSTTYVKPTELQMCTGDGNIIINMLSGDRSFAAAAPRVWNSLPDVSITVLSLRTLLRNCWRRTWWTVCRPRRLWRWIGAIRNKLIIIIYYYQDPAQNSNECQWAHHAHVSDPHPAPTAR